MFLHCFNLLKQAFSHITSTFSFFKEKKKVLKTLETFDKRTCYLVPASSLWLCLQALCAAAEPDYLPVSYLFPHLSFLMHIPHWEKSNQFFQVQGKHFPSVYVSFPVLFPEQNCFLTSALPQLRWNLTGCCLVLHYMILHPGQKHRHQTTPFSIPSSGRTE